MNSGHYGTLASRLHHGMSNAHDGWLVTAGLSGQQFSKALAVPQFPLPVDLKSGAIAIAA
jgi:hypothetical protein